MAHIVCITGGLTGIFNASMALVEQLVAAGHEVTYASPADWRAAVEAQGIPYVQLETWVMQPSEPPMSRWQKLWQLRSRQKKAVDGLGVNNFAQKMRSLSPDLLLIDMEMHPHIIAAVEAGLTVGLLCQFLSVWHRPNLPPIHTSTVPGEGWRGSRWGIELSWLRHGWEKWQAGQRESWRRAGCDRISVLRCYARQIGDSYRPLHWRASGWRQWLVPYPHTDALSILCLNASELDFPHSPHPTMHYVGPMVQPQRPQLQVNEQTHRQVMDFLAHRTSTQSLARSLIYCSCSTFVKSNEHFLRAVIAAVAAQPEWELVLGLGGQLSPQTLGELPPRVHAFDWVPQMLLLQYADCAIHNGGINSLNECLYHGVPMLIYSLKRYDQDGNAARAAYHGLGITGDIEQDDAEKIEAYLQQLLSDRKYRQRAAAMSDRVRAYAKEERAAKAVASLLGSSDYRQEASQYVAL